MSVELSSIRDRFKPILMSSDKIAGHLEITNLSSDLDESEVQEFAKHFKVYKLPAGDILFGEGDPETYMGVLIKGKLAVLKQGPDGQMQKISEIGPGKTVGEMSLIDGQPRSATIQVVEEAFVMVLYQGRFDELLQNQPGLGVKLLLYLMRLMSARLRMTSNTVATSVSR
ncbi:MAG: cyclic nucleotide-binding domain-containing protein [Verrucomicrobiae bacterium]|nr:cyclic nucleotide-binding domain-containing protein [Verrucomicrobiae bacterium]